MRDVLRIEVVFDRPLSPDPRNGNGGVEQDSVHVEQNTLTLKVKIQVIPREISAAKVRLMIMTYCM